MWTLLLINLEYIVWIGCGGVVVVVVVVYPVSLVFLHYLLDV